MALKFSIKVPRDYLLARDGCSYGYFLLEPNHWDPRTRTFLTTLDLRGTAVTLKVRQGADRGGTEAVPGSPGWVYDPHRTGPGRAGAPLSVHADRDLSPAQVGQARAALSRILRLDEAEETIAAFHELDPRFAASGRGRLMRSATLFEDVIKTVTSCNVTWPSTVNMNTRLCRVLGRKSASGLYAFPSVSRLAAARPALLRARCSVGYRDQRIVELAGIFKREARARRGQAARRAEEGPAWMLDPALGDTALFKQLQELPGIGPYAAANVMQLLGRYARLPLDTESVRHGRVVLGMTGSSKRIMARLHRHYEPFGGHAFRSYWFELWRFYEAKRGHSWTWERETTGRSFTAALLAD